MANRNKITLIGNTGSDIKIIETEDSQFACFSLATSNSYQNEKGEWKETSPQWHRIIIFNPKLFNLSFIGKKGARIQIDGNLSYRPRTITEIDVNGNMKETTIMEASIIAFHVKPAPLIKKNA